MMQYLFQGWNCREPGKYKDMLLDIGTEEIGHVEMLATIIACLLDKPLKMQAVFINSVILIVSAATFEISGHQTVVEIQTAYQLLSPLLGVSIACLWLCLIR